jgi:hypothetical protein
MAVGIQARAIKRCGELLRALQGAEHGGRPQKNNGGAPHFSAWSGEKCRFVESQEKQAKRVANVPDEEFEELVESDNPPTVSRLGGPANVVFVPRNQLSQGRPSCAVATGCVGRPAGATERERRDGTWQLSYKAHPHQVPFAAESDATRIRVQ